MKITTTISFIKFSLIGLLLVVVSSCAKQDTPVPMASSNSSNQVSSVSLNDVSSASTYKELSSGVIGGDDKEDDDDNRGSGIPGRHH